MTIDLIPDELVGPGPPRCGHHTCLRVLTGPHPMVPEDTLTPMVRRALDVGRAQAVREWVG